MDLPQNDPDRQEFTTELAAQWLMWPERFDEKSVASWRRSLARTWLPAAWRRCQNRQAAASSNASGGSIWPPVDYPQYKDTARNKLPPISFALASLDTAYGEKEENSFNALTIWGLWQHATAHDAYVIAANDGQIMRLPKDERPKVCLMYAWTKKLPINGEDEERPDFDDDGEPLSEKAWNSRKWLERRQKKWGLVEWVV